MMQATESWHGYNFSALDGILFCFAASRRFLSQCEMSAVLVVKADVIIHEAFQMLLVQNDHMVEKIPAAVADPAFGDTVLPRTSEARSLGLNAEGLHRIDHLRVEAGTAIKDQILGCRVVRERLAQLLNHPLAGRVPGDVPMQDAPPVMGNDEEAVEDSERESRYGEEIHCRNRLAMVIQECHPSLRRFRISRSLSHPAQYGSLRNVEAKHPQFTVNPRRTPGWVFGNHAEDEVAQFLAYASSSHACSMPREPRPIQLEACPVPANHCLRLHEEQRPLPSRPKPPQNHPKQFVGSGKSRLRVPLPQDAQLLPERQVFQEQVAARTDRANEQDEQEPQRTRHVPLVAEPQKYRAGNLVKLPKEKPSGNLDCSRFCTCQSTKKPQGSTGTGQHAVRGSVKSSYFHSISIGFNKPSDLFWDRWSALFNYFIINNLYKFLHRVSIASTSHCGFLNAGFWELRARFCEEIPVNRLDRHRGGSHLPTPATLLRRRGGPPPAPPPPPPRGTGSATGWWETSPPPPPPKKRSRGILK